MITSCLLLRVCVVVLLTLVQCGSKSLFLPTWQLPVQSEALRLTCTRGSHARKQWGGQIDCIPARNRWTHRPLGGKIASRNFLSFSPQR
jgi:hypothetical protein